MALRARYVSAIAVAAGFGILATGATASPKALVTVNTMTNATLGKILVSGGRTLYHPSIACTGSCTKQWPPLLATDKPIAGPGVVSSKLGTVKLSTGKLQVTYAGKSLYLYAGDKKAGQVNGQGEGGVWHAVAPTGSLVTKSLSSSASTKSSGSSTASSGSSSSGSSSSSSSGSSGSSGSSTSSGSSSSGSSSSGSSGSSGSNTGGGNSNNGTGDCATNPGADGCM